MAGTAGRTKTELERLRGQYLHTQQELAEARAQVAERDRQLGEAWAREQATTEILRAISRSPSDLQVVLDAIADSALRRVSRGSD